jgi:hypothetical protein
MWSIRSRQFWIATLLGLLWASPAGGAPALREGFEGQDPSWHDSGGDAQYKIASQTRVSGVSHSGQSCEQIRLVGNNGSYVYLSHDLSAAQIINELSLSVWLKADRAGLQLLARAVLPRSKDPATGQPLTVLLTGSGYTQGGSWQQLRLDNIPQQFERQLRVLRAEHGPAVDGHEAYIDRAVLNIYGGPGTTTVLIDDLELNGFVGPAGGPPAQPKNSSAFAERLPGVDRTVPDENARPTAPRLSGSGLMLGDQPLFPRLLEYRGEPLSLVKSLGFNGIWMSTTPREALLREAAATGLRLVAPPPSIGELETRVPAGADGVIDRQFDPILAWDLGSTLSTKELPVNKRWSQLVRSTDSRSRPLICGPDSDLWSYSRNVDLLWISRSPLGSSLGLTNYLLWLRERPQWARGGTPAWTMIQTQPSDRIVQQAGLLSGQAAPRVCWQDEQFRLLVFSALAAGARGICFQSSTPLDASDPATRRRVLLLEMINLELDLIEPWCASGSFVTSATGDDTNMGAAIMQTERARLVLPLPNGPFNQFAIPLPTLAPTVNPLLAKKRKAMRETGLKSTPPHGMPYSHIPAVPESNQAYELSPVAFRPVNTKRTAGGPRPMLTDENRTSLLVFTQDSTVVANLTRRVERVRPRAAELTRELAALHLARVDDVHSRLVAKGHAPAEAKGWLEGARAYLQQAETQAAAKGEQQAFYSSRKAEQLLRFVERGSWELTMRPIAAPLSTPLGICFDTLPEYWQFIGETSSATRGPNLLPAADFEDLQAAINSGWRYAQHPQPKDLQFPQPTLTTSVTASTEVVHGGKSSLRLEVAAAKAEEVPSQVETAPMWLVSAPVRIEAGRVALIHGWVNIPKRITGSVDGLLIIDSLSGEPLAERVLQTADWQEFSMYRAAPTAQAMTVTFALSGLGEVYLDDVTIQIIDRPTGVTTPQTTPPPAAAAAQGARSQTAGRQPLGPAQAPR